MTFTVQDATGTFEFEGAGEALASLLSEYTPATMYGVNGGVIASQDDEGITVDAPVPAILTRVDDHGVQVEAVIVDVYGYAIVGGVSASIWAWLADGWTLS